MRLLGSTQIYVAGTRMLLLHSICSHAFLMNMKIAYQYNSVFDKLLNAYTQIGEALPRFGKYMEVFQQPGFRQVLSLIYTDIIEFHRRAYQILIRRGRSCLHPG